MAMASSTAAPTTQTSFTQQRDMLIREIAISLEHVLMNINKLNRNLEGVLAVGKEFDSVEALWSQFEGVMAREEGEGGEETGEELGEGDVGREEGGR
ncbi:MAG: hypothetical protein M1813_004929 [Trichoglossum hirsutum]|nr:MAG: hypothetical protein M1813_004929 [Trichoglossum hirsutum]